MIRAALMASLLAVAPSAARAAELPGDFQQTMVPALAVLGAVGVLTTGIAALVYANEGVAFDTGWLIASLFSGAFSIATSIHLMVADTAIGPAAPAFGITLALASLWPLGYSVRSAVSPGGFGEPLTSGAFVIPILTLEL